MGPPSVLSRVLWFDVRMRKAKWVLAAALLVGGGFCIALWPSNCEGKFLGPPSLRLLSTDVMDKVCETPLGGRVSWSYDPDKYVDPAGRQVVSISTGPVSAHWGQFALVVVAGAVGASVLTLIVLVLGARRTQKATRSVRPTTIS